MLQDYAETTDTDGLIEEINTICKKKISLSLFTISLVKLFDNQ